MATKAAKKILGTYSTCMYMELSVLRVLPPSPDNDAEITGSSPCLNEKRRQ